MAPGAGDCPAETPTQAPESAPQIKRAISPTGAVRLGVEGSLSEISSAMASTVKMAPAAVDPMNASRVPARLSQPRCAAQAVTAGAVNERIPDTMPIANARTKTKVALMQNDVSPMPVSVKKYETNKRSRPNPFVGKFDSSARFSGVRFSYFHGANFVAFCKSPKEDASHAAVEPYKPYCGVASELGSRQRMDVV